MIRETFELFVFDEKARDNRLQDWRICVPEIFAQLNLREEQAGNVELRQGKPKARFDETGLMVLSQPNPTAKGWRLVNRKRVGPQRRQELIVQF